MLNQVAHVNSLEIIFPKRFSTHINICTNIKVQRHTRCLYFNDVYYKLWGFPGGSVGKKSACSAGDPGSIPGSGRSPGEGNGNPLQDSCLEKPHGQRSLVGYSPGGHKELDMTQ